MTDSVRGCMLQVEFQLFGAHCQEKHTGSPRSLGCMGTADIVLRMLKIDLIAAVVIAVACSSLCSTESEPEDAIRMCDSRISHVVA
jgi:hypothetical protein